MSLCPVDHKACQCSGTAADPCPEVEALRKDAERYRTLRDNGYLERLCGELHPCDEPRRMELTDAQVDRYAELHARRAVGAA